MNKVLKNEDLLKKTSWPRKTYPLKLNLTDIQKCRLDMMFYEYKKATNKIINTILNEFFKKHLVQLSEEKEGKCPLCQKEKKLAFQLNDFSFVCYNKEKNFWMPIYKKGEISNICNLCYFSHYSLRKFVSPSKNRPIPIEEWDFTKHTKMKRCFDSCLQKAVETIKSQEQIKKKIKWRINHLRERIMNNNVDLNKKTGNYEKYGEKLKKFIKNDEREIERLKKSFAEKIEFKGTAIRLYENDYNLIKEDNNFFIKLKNFLDEKENFTLEFYGENYQKKLASKFIDNKKSETELIKKGDNYYLQYIYRQENKVPIPDETFTAIGIDINIINLACYVALNKKDKIEGVEFFNGRLMRYKRQRMADVRKEWGKKLKHKKYGGKGRSYKWYKQKCKSQGELSYVKYTIHNLTTKIAQEIKDRFEKPVIVLEDLKDIRTKNDRQIKIALKTLKKIHKKSKKYIREHRKLTSDLNKWNFADFQNFLEYKANWLGIPVVYVPAKDTSIKCNKCGYIDEKNYKNYRQVLFKCKKCGYECNIDFNAGVNIGRKFYIYIQEQEERGKGNSSLGQVPKCSSI